MDYMGGGQLRGKVVSDTPGRLRIRVFPEHRDPCAMRRLQGALQAQPGVQSVEVNSATGSLLVWYEPDQCSVEGVLDACRLSGLEAQPGEPGYRAAPVVPAAPAAPPAPVVLATAAPDRRLAFALIRHAFPAVGARAPQARRVWRVAARGAKLAKAIRLGVEIAQAPGPGLVWLALDVLF